MLLTARALGLGTTLTTLYLLFEKEAEAALGLPPGVHSCALLPIGYPMGRFGWVRRVPLTGVVFENRWGQAYPTRQVTRRRLRLLRLANGVSPRRRAASRSMHGHRGQRLCRQLGRGSAGTHPRSTDRIGRTRGGDRHTTRSRGSRCRPPWHIIAAAEAKDGARKRFAR